MHLSFLYFFSVFFFFVSMCKISPEKSLSIFPTIWRLFPVLSMILGQTLSVSITGILIFLWKFQNLWRDPSLPIWVIKAQTFCLWPPQLYALNYLFTCSLPYCCCCFLDQQWPIYYVTPPGWLYNLKDKESYVISVGQPIW